MSLQENCPKTRQRGANRRKAQTSSKERSDSEFNKVKEMVDNLRVVELKSILSFMNISKVGRKEVLKTRILEALNKNFEFVSAKIEEVYTAFISTSNISNITRLSDEPSIGSDLEKDSNGVAGIKKVDFTRHLIKKILNDGAESDISTTMMKVSLICPLSKLRITNPCRALTCTHLQCFDAYSFLQMNELKPKWICPVCCKPAAYDTLLIDGYFQEVLASPTLTVDDTEIQLHKDGSWSPYSSKIATQSLDTSANSEADNVEILDDDEKVAANNKISTSSYIVDLTQNDSFDGSS